MSLLLRSLDLAAKRLLELRLMNSSIVWTDVVHPLLVPMTEEDRDFLLEAVVEISLDASPNHAQRKWLRPIFSQWLALNPQVFRLIRISNDHGIQGVAGFTCVIPLSDDAMDRYRSGRLSEWDFDKPCGGGQSAILAPSSEPSRNICIQAITLRQKFWRKYAAGTLPLKMLLSTLVEHLAVFNPVPFKLKPCLIADGNIRGTHILQNHGFQPLALAANTVDGRPLFQLDFATLKETISLKARMTIDALERWMTLAGCIDIASRFFRERECADVLLATLIVDYENAFAALATGTQLTWTILVFARVSVSLNTQVLEASLSAAANVMIMNPDAVPAIGWSNLRRQVGRHLVALVCTDQQVGYAVHRRLLGSPDNASVSTQPSNLGQAPMIELATAATAAALLNNSVTAIDKVYNWWRAKQGNSAASEGLRNDPQNQVLQYVPLTGAARPAHVVMTYSELATRLTTEDVSFIKTFERRMRLAMTQWEALNADLPLASPVERARIEANMENIKDKDICFSLKQIVDFIEKLGIDLHDHYAGVRSICSAEL